MSGTPEFNAPSRTTPETHQRNKDKLSRIPVKVVPSAPLRKPPWLRVKSASIGKVQQIKKLLRDQKLYSVCEEAACPNLPECFSKGTATFMIMGDLCTRRCPFCDVAHGKPRPLDPEEPEHLAETISALKLRYVVITSVDRDDLRDGGARHFLNCIQAIRSRNPDTRVEFLVPDFRGRIEIAIRILADSPPDVFNHNLETVPRLYKKARPGASYAGSLELLRRFRDNHPDIPTKSGLMLGLGEEIEEVEQVMRDLRASHCSMLTLGQYLQPSRDHLPVARFVTPEEFDRLAENGRKMGFAHVASGPLVRSSYHADIQAQELVG
ncbi:MAG: lipoyl synthase [Methylococcaceae bacterium]|nr:lipoyl synthase [Methylococcaceae bacterium]